MITDALPPSWPLDCGEHVAHEMAAAWRRGERLRAEEYLQRYPALLDSAHDAVRVIFEEVCLRQEAGEQLAADEILGRFPKWKDELALMLDCHSLVRAQFPRPTFPEVGEALGGFRLISELGRGTSGRVYLATQPTLADRPVVLKVTPRVHRESLSLARLQHTHIIPLHGVHDFPSRDLQALCQPYHGGATLAQLHDMLRATPPDLRSGRTLVQALDESATKAKIRLSSQKGPRELLARLPYAEAIAWIGACLADALEYAHQRGLVHLDLKPANVLLAADGQPLLLDFHLARHPLASGQSDVEGLGGTPDFMSPEQAEAYLAASRNLPIPQAVDHRSDIYSLGRLLYLVLGGKEEDRTPLPLRRCNPLVSVGLADIIHRCLAAEADRRYPSMAALAADLRLHLGHRPLRGVANRSVSERWHKWRVRKPHAALWCCVILTCLVSAGFLLHGHLDNRREAHQSLEEARDEMQRGAFTEALHSLARSRARAQRLVASQGLLDLLNQEDQRARRAIAAGNLHTLVDKLRLLAGTEALSPADLRALEGHCRSAWQTRSLFAMPKGGDLEDNVRTDLVDLALLWLDLKRRLAPGGQLDSRAAAQILDDAVLACCSNPLLNREHKRLERPQDPLEGVAQGSGWEHTAAGRAMLLAGDLDRAAAEFARAIESGPQDFWAHFYKGVCAFRRRQFDEAILAFSVASALAPQFAEVYHNRALAYEAAGKKSEALGDYNRALARAPGLAPAALNKGILFLKEKRYAEALHSLNQAQKSASDSVDVHYNLALAHWSLHHRDAAVHHLERVLAQLPTHASASALYERVLAEAPDTGIGERAAAP